MGTDNKIVSFNSHRSVSNQKHEEEGIDIDGIIDERILSFKQYYGTEEKFMNDYAFAYKYHSPDIIHQQTYVPCISKDPSVYLTPNMLDVDVYNFDEPIILGGFDYYDTFHTVDQPKTHEDQTANLLMNIHLLHSFDGRMTHESLFNGERVMDYNVYAIDFINFDIPLFQFIKTGRKRDPYITKPARFLDWRYSGYNDYKHDDSPISNYNSEWVADEPFRGIDRFLYIDFKRGKWFDKSYIFPYDGISKDDYDMVIPVHRSAFRLARVTSGRVYYVRHIYEQIGITTIGQAVNEINDLYANEIKRHNEFILSLKGIKPLKVVQKFTSTVTITKIED